MQEWAEKKLDELEKEDLCGFVFKSRSPSSGMRRVKVYTPSGKISGSGAGIFGGAFVKRFPLTPAEEDGRLHDPALRENFIERVFVFKRWREFEKGDGSVRGLLQFHTDHKLLVLAHSPRHYSALGNLVAKARKDRTESLRRDYAGLLMEGLRLEATVKKNTNVLQHMMGYFKKLLTQDEKKELLEIITEYHKGSIPLIVPVVLIRHYVRKYEVSYLGRQLYINPHPAELMLRNHV
jgi:uncharacterized protein YbgA (DUF1722 family)